MMTGLVYVILSFVILDHRVATANICVWPPDRDRDHLPVSEWR